MSKGFLVIAQNNKDCDYIRMAYALALSVKNTQKNFKEFAIGVEDKTLVPEKFKYVFDYIVEIPYGDHAKNDDWKINNKWKYVYLSPFDETIVLDTDMLLTSDISVWWEILKNRELDFCCSPVTYRAEKIVSNAYRSVFVENSLPNLYTACFYFKKTDFVFEFFKLLEIIFNNWQRFYYEYLDNNRPTFLSGDVCYALAAKILGIEDEIKSTVLTFTHMKSKIQNIPLDYITEDWTRHLPSYINEDCEIKIGNFKQMYPFHYHVKSWLTNDIVKKLELKYKEK